MLIYSLQPTVVRYFHFLHGFFYLFILLTVEVLKGGKTLRNLNPFGKRGKLPCFIKINERTSISLSPDPWIQNTFIFSRFETHLHPTQPHVTQFTLSLRELEETPKKWVVRVSLAPGTFLISYSLLQRTGSINPY